MPALHFYVSIFNVRFSNNMQCCICMPMILKGISGFTYCRRVIFPFGYTHVRGDPLRRLNTHMCYGFSDAIACPCTLSRESALTLLSHEFCNKSRVGRRPLIFSSNAAPNIFSRPFSTLPSTRLQPLVYSHGISLPHSSSALLTSAAIARS